MSRSSFNLAFSLFAAALLSGCGSLQEKPLTSLSSTSTTTTPATPSTTPGSPIAGNVHGGALPIVGAHIYLLAANPAGYGAPSINLLNPAQPNVAFDDAGYYVLTDKDGFFHISGDYACSSGQQVYLLALGGNPGLPAGQTNPAIALMAALGACPEGATNFAAVPYIIINEVSTVAAAYALSGFITDPTHLGSSSTPNALRGVANAFLTVPNLVDITSGTGRIQTVAGNGDVPQAEINTLANMLVTCVNSDGGSNGSLSCGPLFSNAPDLSGVPPTNTISAILNIARRPATNVAALFSASQITATFQPALTAAPNDWSLALSFYADKMVGPYFPAIDSMGNIWVPAYGNNTLVEFDSAGAILSGKNGFTGGGLNLPYSIAIDSRDNPWVINFGPISASTVSKFSTTGAALVSTPYACDAQCFFPAFDAAQNLWISGSQHAIVLGPDGSVVKKFSTSAFDSGVAINSAGIGWSIGQPSLLYKMALPATVSSTSELTTAASNDLTFVAIDSSDKVWYASAKNNAIGVSDKNGALVSPANGYTGGGLKGPAQIAIDGSNRVWVANRDGNSLSAFSNSGVAISPAKGYQAANISNPRGLAIDASGNVWLTNFTYNSLTEFIGIATPTATPISSATHGQRP